MYHVMVRQKVRGTVDHRNRGDFGFVLDQFAPDAEHWFSGSHALSGLRRTAALRAAWYKRLDEVLPGLQFQIEKIVISGAPWRTWVAIGWRDRVFDLRGAERAPNRGMFMLIVRWGRAVKFHVYCDTQGLASNLRVIAAQGKGQAAAAPIAGVVL